MSPDAGLSGSRCLTKLPRNEWYDRNPLNHDLMSVDGYRGQKKEEKVYRCKV